MFFHKAMTTEIKMLAGNTNSAFFPILFIKYNSNNSSRKTSRRVINYLEISIYRKFKLTYKYFFEWADISLLIKH